MAKLIRCPEPLYERAANLAQERGISLGAALEMMTSTSSIQPKVLKPLTQRMPRTPIAPRPSRSMNF
jgi:hypothetical protein